MIWQTLIGNILIIAWLAVTVAGFVFGGWRGAVVAASLGFGAWLYRAGGAGERAKTDRKAAADAETVQNVRNRTEKLSPSGIKERIGRWTRKKD